MSEEVWVYPDADDHGFISLKRLKQLAAERSPCQFLRSFPRPALQVVDEVASDRQPAESHAGGFRLLTMKVKSSDILRYLTKVAFIAKRPGNPFPHLISIGRSQKNDLVVTVGSVSKVHGYFVPADDGWDFTDRGSTNGSMLNGQVLEVGEHYRLEDGDLLQLGLEVVFEFLSPESLYARGRARGLVARA